MAERKHGTPAPDTDVTAAQWLHGADLSVRDLRGSDLSSLEPAKVDLPAAGMTIALAIDLTAALGLDVQPE